MTQITWNPKLRIGRMMLTPMHASFLFGIIVFIFNCVSAISQQETGKDIGKDRTTDRSDSLQLQQQQTLPSGQAAAINQIYIGRVKNLPLNLDQENLDTLTIFYLDTIIKKLKSDPSLKVQVGGHSENNGTVSEQEKRAMQRAIRVREYLLNHGMDPSQVLARSFGARLPAYDNRTDSGRLLNNRVAVTLVKEK
jgi:outer membrane protein OmpA-like peptidoglycan-associated protein